MKSQYPGSRLALVAAAAVGILNLISLASAPGPAPGPVNLDLEEGELGKVPTGWHQPKPSVDAGYKVELTDDRPKSGKRCVLVSRDGKDKPAGAGILLQSFDAKAYRGKRVRFRAAVRADVTGAGNQAQLWLRVDRKNDQRGFFDNMDDRPITLNEWRFYNIHGDVADDAEAIFLGLLLVGNGKAWMDAGSFEIVGKAGEGNEPARALKDNGLENLVAFTKLLGYVRYFHPSDAAKATDWTQFAIDSVEPVEAAKNAEELAQVLEKRCQPIAPTVRVFPTKKPPAGGAEVPPPKDPPPTKILAWLHVGVGITYPSIYSSTRINLKEPLPRIHGDKPPDIKLPDPSKPFAADLGAGVSCWVPLAVYADDKGTLPRTDPVKAPGSKRPEGWKPSGNDRSTRLADVALAWNVFQHFYPYFDVVKTDWPAELRRALTAAATDADDNAFADTLSRLVAALHDGHGNLYHRSVSYPPLRWDWVENRLVVTQVAAKGVDGLTRGDVVAKVNGKPAAEALAETEQLISGATPQWTRFRGLSQLGEGPADSEITLEVVASPGKTRTVRLKRSLDYYGFHDIQEPLPAKVEEIKPGIMYVDLDRISAKDFQEALPRLEKAKGIIYDLRGYPSQAGTDCIAHLTDKPVRSAQWHVPVAMYPDRQHVVFAVSGWDVQPKKPRFQAKVAFLTGGGAISQAETFLGIVEHYKLADIVGGPTAGTNGNINPFKLPGDYSLVWTGMKVLKHDGSRHHGVGIQPTVPVARTIQGVAQGRDEVLERGIKVVSP
jgi:C-terminal processing protease CtpA/Prc